MKLTSSLSFLAIATFLFGCTSFHAERVGQHRYAKTNRQQVAIWSPDRFWANKANFFGGSEPSEPYNVIGTLSALYCSDAEKTVLEFQKMASQLGADAVVIRNNEVVNLTFGDAIKYRDPEHQLPAKKP